MRTPREIPSQALKGSATVLTAAAPGRLSESQSAFRAQSQAVDTRLGHRLAVLPARAPRQGRAGHRPARRRAAAPARIRLRTDRADCGPWQASRTPREPPRTAAAAP